ncbi:MAG: CsgG/HfaB family protein [Litorimonas sp.]
MLNKVFKYRRRKIVNWLMASSCAVMMSACTTVPASHDFLTSEAKVTKITKTQLALKALSPPENKVTVAVYNFEDKTGQFRPSETGQTLSRAVSQGGDEVLIKALQDTGNRSWFTVIERSNLNNLLKERQIITEMRARYLGETKLNSKALPPLLFAGVIFEGGIVGFDTNTLTGGVAARYLGIGGQTDYRQSVVTVHLRAVSVKTGEVLTSVTTEKTISSVGIAANAFRFVTFDNLLEADAGVTSNEPGLLALRQAVEKSVYALVMEGSEIGLWNFFDKAEGYALLQDYKYERDGVRLKTKPNPKLAQAKPAGLKAADQTYKNSVQTSITTEDTPQINGNQIKEPASKQAQFQGAPDQNITGVKPVN